MIGPAYWILPLIEYETCPRTIFNKWENTVYSIIYVSGHPGASGRGPASPVVRISNPKAEQTAAFNSCRFSHHSPARHNRSTRIGAVLHKIIWYRSTTVLHSKCQKIPLNVTVTCTCIVAGTRGFCAAGATSSTFRCKRDVRWDDMSSLQVCAIVVLSRQMRYLPRRKMQRSTVKPHFLHIARGPISYAISEVIPKVRFIIRWKMGNVYHVYNSAICSSLINP